MGKQERCSNAIWLISIPTLLILPPCAETPVFHATRIFLPFRYIQAVLRGEVKDKGHYHSSLFNNSRSAFFCVSSRATLTRKSRGAKDILG